MARDETHVTEVDGEAEGSNGPSADAVAEDIEVVEHDVEELLARVLDAEAKRDEYLADLQRLAADFDNYRKRVQREQSMARVVAAAELVMQLLPVVDDLERALAAAEEHDEAKVIEGVRLTKEALLSTLRSEGLEEIEIDGPFDPYVHEALMTQPAEGVDSGSILQVIQKGYRLGDSVVRPARVIVAE
jgi:molecular chaperone GrpE